MPPVSPMRVSYGILILTAIPRVGGINHRCAAGTGRPRWHKAIVSRLRQPAIVLDPAP